MKMEDYKETIHNRVLPLIEFAIVEVDWANKYRLQTKGFQQ